ncbi:hypothetical protein NPIL_139721, partial [Nephila pilipes]
KFRGIRKKKFELKFIEIVNSLISYFCNHIK